MHCTQINVSQTLWTLSLLPVCNTFCGESRRRWSKDTADTDSTVHPSSILWTLRIGGAETHLRPGGVSPSKNHDLRLWSRLHHAADWTSLFWRSQNKQSTRTTMSSERPESTLSFSLPVTTGELLQLPHLPVTRDSNKEVQVCAPLTCDIIVTTPPPHTHTHSLLLLLIRKSNYLHPAAAHQLVTSVSTHM